MATVHRLWPRFGWSSHRHERQIWSVRLSQMSWPLTLTQTCHDEVQLLNTDYIIFTYIYICLFSIYNVNFISVIIYIYYYWNMCWVCQLWWLTTRQGDWSAQGHVFLGVSGLGIPSVCWIPHSLLAKSKSHVFLLVGSGFWLIHHGFLGA